MSAETFRRYSVDYDALKPLDITTYLTTPPKKYEPTETTIAERAKEVLAHWKRDENRHYDKFYTALDEVRSSDEAANELFGLYLSGDTARLGDVLSRKVAAELESMADQYARDEFAGALGSRDERIPL
jgi:hypothetical protein